MDAANQGTVFVMWKPGTVSVERQARPAVEWLDGMHKRRIQTKIDLTLPVVRHSPDICRIIRPGGENKWPNRLNGENVWRILSRQLGSICVLHALLTISTPEVQVESP